MLGGPVTAVAKRLAWLGPATVAASIAAVFVVQQIALRIFNPLPRQYSLSPIAGAFAFMHVAAWAVTVLMLTL
jgi:hypothetical protein